ncbi:MAG: ABC transporter ATP-binding protein [Pseudoxanthomonas sp.]
MAGLDQAAAHAYLRLRGVSKHFERTLALDHTDLDVARGEIFALLGASGCGKSTLLRCLAGFETPSAGEIFLDGQSLANVPAYARPVNMMFQSYALFPHMSVAQNIAFGLKQERLPKADIAARVAQMLALVQLEPLAQRKPHQLSGGQQQRVALARALAKRPKLLLLDEPMAALDRQLRTQMQLELAGILKRSGVTCVLVTHDQEEAMSMADRIALMDAGRICQVGTPEAIYARPANRAAARFIGSVNLFDAVVAQDGHGRLVLQSASIAASLQVEGLQAGLGQTVALAVRPEQIQLGREAPTQRHNCLQGVIEASAYFGRHAVHHVRLPGGERVMADAAHLRQHAGAGFCRGEAVWLWWDARDGVVLLE